MTTPMPRSLLVDFLSQKGEHQSGSDREGKKPEDGRNAKKTAPAAPAKPILGIAWPAKVRLLPIRKYPITAAQSGHGAGRDQGMLEKSIVKELEEVHLGFRSDDEASAEGVTTSTREP